MKYGRLFLFFLLAVIATTAILSFMQPTYQKVERSIVINTPATVIYDQLIKLDNFNKFSVWSQQDSTAVYTLSGTDGTVGASTAWKGSPEISGEGKIEITGLEPSRKVTHQFHFTQPKKGKAVSSFTLAETNKATTTVTWTFNMATPRPWNIFNLFYSLDKQMGKDFEDGLVAMKKMIELNGAANATRLP
ncbi:MAG: SRPBCC family protein [Bacteroidota bacterium]|mgnify:CR=1 FL=1|nr:SRPBCC family protein [Bacteroidota bacterium]